jgi:hypothetical protein
MLLQYAAILTLELFWCQTSNANQANKGYIPPTDRQSNSSQTRQAAGSRGCNVGNRSTFLSLSISQNFILENTSSNPSIKFNISSIPKQPIVVTLTQPNRIEPLFETQINANRSGAWLIIARPEIPLLENQQYVWTVMIVCNNLNPSQNQYVRSSFTYISNTSKTEIYSKRTLVEP